MSRLLLTGASTALVGLAMFQSQAFEAWIAWPGMVIGIFLVGSLEFAGRFEETGWRPAGSIVPIAYTAWSLWLVCVGLVFSSLGERGRHPGKGQVSRNLEH